MSSTVSAAKLHYHFKCPLRSGTLDGDRQCFLAVGSSPEFEFIRLKTRGKLKRKYERDRSESKRAVLPDHTLTEQNYALFLLFGFAKLGISFGGKDGTGECLDGVGRDDLIDVRGWSHLSPGSRANIFEDAINSAPVGHLKECESGRYCFTDDVDVAISPTEELEQIWLWLHPGDGDVQTATSSATVPEVSDALDPMDSEPSSPASLKTNDSGTINSYENAEAGDVAGMSDVPTNIGVAETRSTLGWHTFRHTFASWLAASGVPIPVVQALLGHSTIVMTMRYTHVVPTALRQAISTLTLHQPEPNREFWAPGGQQSPFPATASLTAGIV